MLEFICENVIGSAAALMLLSVGLFFSFRLKFFYFLHPIRSFKAIFKKKSVGGISPFRALMLALAGTLGVGNIAGVASSIAIGGYGSVLWMWVSALIATVLKYAEILLAVVHRRRDIVSGEYYGGAPYYIKDHFSSNGKKGIGRALAIIFALLCIVNSVTMGCVIQSNAISSSFSGVMGVKAWIVGALVAAFACIVIVGNARWVSGFCEKVVPIMTLGYILLSVAVIAARWRDIPWAISAIFDDAFDVRSIAGGAVGFLLSRSMRAGTMRGLMSNEAGCGTAPTAHASANADSPAAQGLWGIIEVVVDTLLLCTLTAVVIILAGGEVSGLSEDPMMMAIRSFSTVLGRWSEYYMCISVLLFAFATMVCWAHYGKESVRYITKSRSAQVVYILAFCVFIFLGAVAAPSYAWLFADLAIGVMTLINLPVLFLMRREVVCETAQFLLSTKKSKNSGG